MRTSPETNGTKAFCFFPYMKNPSPIVLNKKPHTKRVVSIEITCLSGS